MELVSVTLEQMFGMMKQHMTTGKVRICAMCRYFRSYPEEPSNSTCVAQYDYANAGDEACPLFIKEGEHICADCKHFLYEDSMGKGYCEARDTANAYCYDAACSADFEERPKPTDFEGFGE